MRPLWLYTGVDQYDADINGKIRSVFRIQSISPTIKEILLLYCRKFLAFVVLVLI